jgi:hypothetical protein
MSIVQAERDESKKAGRYYYTGVSCAMVFDRQINGMLHCELKYDSLHSSEKDKGILMLKDFLTQAE